MTFLMGKTAYNAYNSENLWLTTLLTRCSLWSGRRIPPWRDCCAIPFTPPTWRPFCCSCLPSSNKTCGLRESGWTSARSCWINSIIHVRCRLAVFICIRVTFANKVTRIGHYGKLWINSQYFDTKSAVKKMWHTGGGGELRERIN